MHLLQDSRLSAMDTHRLTPALIQGRRKALLSLVRSFCRLIHKIEDAPAYTHKLLGRSSPWQRLVRRNADFLLTCWLNASSWQREVPSEYATTVGAVNKVLRSPYHKAAQYGEAQLRLTWQQALRTTFSGFPSILNCLDEDSVARGFSQSFEHCGGKDNLQIIEERGDTASHFSFLDPDVPTIQLESLPTLSIAPARSGLDECLDPVHRERDEKDIADAELIWKNWKIGYRRREFFKTPYGQAISYIRRLCKKVIERPPLHPREIMACRAVLFARGPSLYTYCEETKKKYSRVKQALVRQREKSGGSRITKQAFQRQWETLSAMSNLTQTAGLLDENNWQNLRVPSGVLGEKIDEAIEALKAINAKLRVITGRG